MAPFTRPWDRDADHRCRPTFRLMSNDPLLYTINLDSLIRTAFKQEEKKYDPSTTTIDNLHSLSRISLFNNNNKKSIFFLSLQICITAAREGGRTHQEPVMPPPPPKHLPQFCCRWEIFPSFRFLLFLPLKDSWKFWLAALPRCARKKKNNKEAREEPDKR